MHLMYLHLGILFLLMKKKFKLFSLTKQTFFFNYRTIWFEMLSIIYYPSYEYPFASFSTDTVIYLIGSGCKDLTPNIQFPKEFKVI